jgi:hypothetical protein
MFCTGITDQIEGRRRHAAEFSKRPHANVLPVPSQLTSIRADVSMLDDFKLARGEDAAWDTFKSTCVAVCACLINVTSSRA